MFEILSITDLVFIYIIILLILVFIAFKWFFNQVREIAKDTAGLIKFGQITFIILSWSVFIAVTIYYFIKPQNVDSVSIVLTIVVGFLGTMIGLFFSEKSIDHLKGKIEKKDTELSALIPKLEEVPDLLDEIKLLKAKSAELKRKLEKKKSSS